MKRRTVLAAGLGAIASGAVSAKKAETGATPPSTSTAEPWPKAAFDATTTADALARLGIPSKPQPGPTIYLDVPDISPAAQPIRVVIETALPKVDRVVVLADRLPRPLIAVLEPAPQSSTRLRLTIHLPTTTPVRAVVRSEGQWYAVQREVKLALEAA